MSAKKMSAQSRPPRTCRAVTTHRRSASATQPVPTLRSPARTQTVARVASASGTSSLPNKAPARPTRIGIDIIRCGETKEAARADRLPSSRSQAPIATSLFGLGADALLQPCPGFVERHLRAGVVHHAEEGVHLRDQVVAHLLVVLIVGLPRPAHFLMRLP